MKKLLVLLGIIFIFALSGCGRSDGISGTWVPKIHSDNMRVESIQFTKENDFSYKGIVTYSDGKQVTSTFKYDKQKEYLLLHRYGKIINWYEKGESINTQLTTKDFGEISFEEYDEDMIKELVYK